MSYKRPLMKVGDFLEIFGSDSDLIHIEDMYGNHLYAGTVGGIYNQNTIHHTQIKDRYVHHITMEEGSKLLIYSETIIAI